MNNLANKTTFWSFLKQTKIRIPIIQRDYAQGRKGKEVLRENFLSSINDALSGNIQLKLDFVYGSGNGDGCFLPLDGQQRLTTLWLLHWYLAYRTGKLRDKGIQDILNRFSYQTRESSQSFIKKLVTEGCEIVLKREERISDAVLRQSWMFTKWRQDLTVQSMLRMLSGEENDKLDGIEEIFKNLPKDTLSSYWEKLMSDTGSCPIIFYQLDIENMGQSDDLYVKMNGRGKPISDFENFKADLLKYFEDKKWNCFLDVETGYPILLDTQWTDFFWDYIKPEIEFDDIYFSFLNRYLFTLMMRKVNKPDCHDKIYNYLYSFIEKKQQRVPYYENGFGIYRELFELIERDSVMNQIDIFENLKLVLTNISKCKDLDEKVNSPYYKDKLFSTVYVYNKKKDGAQDYYSLTQPQIIAFWAVCYYFEREFYIDDKLREWMRIVWNICDFNSEVRDRTVITSWIKELEKIFEDPTKPYECLKNFTVGQDATVFNEHIREEKEKVLKFEAGKYNGNIVPFIGKNWEEVIKEVEQHHFLCGNIRTLLLDSDGNYTWEHFDTKYSCLQHYGELGTVAMRNYLIYDFSRIRKDYWYPVDCDKHSSFWKTILSKRENSQVNHAWLMAEPKDENQLKEYAADMLYKYEQKMIIGTNLLEEVGNNNGIYVATSWVSGGKSVLMHHQASMPYVLMYEFRNTIIFDLLEQEVIELSSEGKKLKVGMINGKEVRFKYKENEYVWYGDGKICHVDVGHQFGTQVNETWSAQDFLSNVLDLPKCNSASV